MAAVVVQCAAAVMLPKAHAATIVAAVDATATSGAAASSVASASTPTPTSTATSSPTSTPGASSRTLTRTSAIAREADAASRYLDVDGVRVHYKDEGTGPVVLLVHGTFGDLADWDVWPRALASRYRVVHLDLPGFGTSGPFTSGNYSVDRQLALVDGLMDGLGAEHFALVGVSYGGLVAFRYAATRTERVSALLLINSAGIEYGGTRRDDTAPRPPPDILTSAIVSRADVESLLDYLIGDAARITPSLVDRKLAYVNIAGRREESVLGRTQYERGDPARVLAHVKAPVLVMWGGRNRVLRTDTAGTFAALLKNACAIEQIVYAEGTHLLNLQIPEKTAADAGRFFDAWLRAPSGRAPACTTARGEH